MRHGAARHSVRRAAMKQGIETPEFPSGGIAFLIYDSYVFFYGCAAAFQLVIAMQQC
jgi:hypothetical protein